MSTYVRHPLHLAESSCLLLIPSPQDERVYACFGALAHRFCARVRREGLWIEGGIPLTSNLAAGEPPSPLRKLLDAEACIISRIELDIAGFVISFTRSGGYGQLCRESYYDELRVGGAGPVTLSSEEIRAITLELVARLEVVAAAGTPEFRDIVGDLGVPLQMNVDFAAPSTTPPAPSHAAAPS